MKIWELQDDKPNHVELWENMIATKNKEWNEKKIDEAHYYAQLSFSYCNLFRVAECKHHAALLPDWAHIQEKGLALTSVARMLVYEKKIEEALHYYEQAFAIDPEDQVAIEEAGWCCYELKQWEQAIQWFTKGALLMDDYETFWEGLALSLAQQQKFEEAITAFKKALDLCNQEYMAYHYDHLLGQCYANLGDFYRALGHYTKSLNANPTYAPALNDIAALYNNEEGDIETAVGYLTRAEITAKENGDRHLLQVVYMNLARLYGQTKEFALHEYYQAKLLEVLGFGNLFDLDEDGDGEDNENS